MPIHCHDHLFCRCAPVIQRPGSLALGQASGIASPYRPGHMCTTMPAGVWHNAKTFFPGFMDDPGQPTSAPADYPSLYRVSRRLSRASMCRFSAFLRSSRICFMPSGSVSSPVQAPKPEP